jgi:hypothetical protein
MPRARRLYASADFFMTVQLTRLSGGTATNFNALAIF